jgi:hypothetical protein
MKPVRISKSSHGLHAILIFEFVTRYWACDRLNPAPYSLTDGELVRKRALFLPISLLSHVGICPLRFFCFAFLLLLTDSSFTFAYPLLLVRVLCYLRLLLAIDAFVPFSCIFPASSICCIYRERVAFALVSIVGRSGGASIICFSAS